MLSSCDYLMFVMQLLIVLIDTVPAVNVSAGDIASLIYLWNPWAIVTCVGSCTSPIENLMVVIMIYGACSRKCNSNSCFSSTCSAIFKFSVESFLLCKKGLHLAKHQ
jgi:hypothetical protein